MNGSTANVVAVDLGASSGRVVLARATPTELELREVHRFANTPVPVRGVLHWDALALFRGVLDGLAAAQQAAQGRLDSVAVDSWAVDYGLLDGDGQLLGNPVHYRDPRTAPALAQALETVGAQALYQATGTALQPFNTVFQLLAERGSARAGAAAQALLIPDLLSYWLGGAPGTELTNASTTGLLDARTRDWATGLADQLGAPVDLFPPLRRPGTTIGEASAQVVAEAGLTGAPLVVAAPSHDTAAAVAGLPSGEPYTAFVSSGTWALVGLTVPEPIINEASRLANFTNEVGARGEIRFLRNVTGFWLLQECIREWRRAGLPVDLDALTAEAATLPALRAVLDVQDPQLLAPGDMCRRVASAAEHTSGVRPQTPAQFTRCLVDSVALAVRHALHDAQALAGRRFDLVHVVGGGVANTLFCQLIADASGVPVLAGPTEAASLGNALYQARALGVVSDDPAHIGAVLRATARPLRYEPRGDGRAWLTADEAVWSARGARPATGGVP